jgi:hypothetical protein
VTEPKADTKYIDKTVSLWHTGDKNVASFCSLLWIIVESVRHFLTIDLQKTGTNVWDFLANLMSNIPVFCISLS